MLEVLRTDPAADFDLVPAAVYWGRRRSGSLMLRYAGEDWVLTSRCASSCWVLPMAATRWWNWMSRCPYAGCSVRNWVSRCGRRVASLRCCTRAASCAIGPDLRTAHHVNASCARVPRAPGEAHARCRAAQPLRARGYAREIAANYSHVFVRFMASVLGRLWNRLYDGVELGHGATLEQVAEGNEIIYVPCHRSHMDYLLLSYVIYLHGYAVAHIASGVNLDLPVIGRFLRKGGAFFIRRSFRGNALYNATLMKYPRSWRGHLDRVLHRGGCAHRRLLQPKTGRSA
jgi:glycerol-3-phosphate O-acyltransferase